MGHYALRAAWDLLNITCAFNLLGARLRAVTRSNHPGPMTLFVVNLAFIR